MRTSDLRAPKSSTRRIRSFLLISALLAGGACSGGGSPGDAAPPADAGAGQVAGDASPRPTTTLGKPTVAAVKKKDDGVTIPSDLLFAFDSAALSPEAEQVLPIALDLATRFPKSVLGIDGFTDSVGDERYNEDLSRRRAESVASWLRAHGVDGKRLTIRGLGAQRPIAENGTAEGRQTNRRVEITVRSKT